MIFKKYLSKNSSANWKTRSLSENTRFANFQSIVDVSRFDLSNPITVNPASIKGLMNQTPTLIMDLNRDGSRLFRILGQVPGSNGSSLKKLYDGPGRHGRPCR